MGRLLPFSPIAALAPGGPGAEEQAGHGEEEDGGVENVFGEGEHNPVRMRMSGRSYRIMAGESKGAGTGLRRGKGEGEH